MVDWNIVNFGPLYLPAKGDEIEMNPKHAVLYRNVIEWEQRKKLFLYGDTVLLNDSAIHAYRFKENYYFVAGDKVMNSRIPVIGACFRNLLLWVRLSGYGSRWIGERMKFGGIGRLKV